jgi:hypothetical protein
MMTMEKKKVKLVVILRRKRRREVSSRKILYLIDKKKKKAGEGGTLGGHQLVPRAQDNSHIRLLGDWAAEGKTPYRQSFPPMVPIGM